VTPEKLEARKMLENAAESHLSGARFVSLRLLAVCPTSLNSIHFKVHRNKQF